jgi:hypothetical protein
MIAALMEILPPCSREETCTLAEAMWAQYYSTKLFKVSLPAASG